MAVDQGDILAQEAEADVVQLARSLYDPASRAWRMDKSGEFWDAVQMARGLGRRGQGFRVAVIDTGFDMTVPALAEHQIAGEGTSDPHGLHGTVAALLVLEVAPGAQLELYPASSGGKLSAARVCGAIEAATRSGVQAINLSLGKMYLADELRKRADGADAPRAGAARRVTAEDIYRWAEDARCAPSWHHFFDVPPSPLTAPVLAAAEAGITVMAAAGNHDGSVYVPALLPEVFSVSFSLSRREVPAAGGLETARWSKPNFEQADFSDFSVREPPSVVGTSFATPLVTGLATLIDDPGDLHAYREVARLSGMADFLMPFLPDGEVDDRKHGTVTRLYADAVARAPHDHRRPANYRPCPGCAFFASSAFINLGLMKLFHSDLDGSEVLLTAAAHFTPGNPHAAANLGLLLGVRAGTAAEDHDTGRARDLLIAAHREASRAVHLRPDHAPYRRRMDEFARGIEDPAQFRMRRN